MIKGFGVQNFKAVGEMANIPLKPITLLFGPNSAGKSSIIQSMLMLKQSLESFREVILAPKGQHVDLGNYKDFIHNHETSNDLVFKFELKDFMFSEYHDNMPDGWEDLVRELNDILEGESVYIEVHIGIDENKKSILVKSFTLYAGEDTEDVILYLRDEDTGFFHGAAGANHKFWTRFITKFKKTLFSSYYLDLEKSNEELFCTYINSGFGNGDGFSEFASNLKISKEASEKVINEWKKQVEERKSEVNQPGYRENYFNKHPLKPIIEACENSTLTVELIETTLETLDNFSIVRNSFLPSGYLWNQSTGQYIGLKDLPVGMYDLNEMKDPATYMVQASAAIDYFLLSIEYIEPLRKLPKRYYSKIDDAHMMQVFNQETVFDYLNNEENLTKINKALADIGISYNLELISFSEISDLFSINLVNTLTGVSSPLKDVGFGISQILPIVIGCISGRRKTFIIEQPELHLHPAAQTELGDLFIDSALGGSKNNFIIETHSEHLILRLLRRIRETADGELPDGCTPITPEDIAVLYVQPRTDGVEIIKLPVNEDGQFDRPWPNGFFAERGKELF